eukprot:TRINITY_DN7694_c0_g1_i2.p4 TRINITY_DN7694_c0_g1~~TRINITY_DN7694_c0_g1_i2.p4  ORF type:complete len:141 (+),score=0.08 TRINITY_DN7694_c0_g1_i2:566-988(+)
MLKQICLLFLILKKKANIRKLTSLKDYILQHCLLFILVLYLCQNFSKNSFLKISQEQSQNSPKKTLENTTVPKKKRKIVNNQVIYRIQRILVFFVPNFIRLFLRTFFHKRMSYFSPRKKKDAFDSFQYLRISKQTSFLSG